MGDPGTGYEHSHLKTRVEVSSACILLSLFVCIDTQAAVLLLLCVCIDTYTYCGFALWNESGGVIYMYTLFNYVLK